MIIDYVHDIRAFNPSKNLSGEWDVAGTERRGLEPKHEPRKTRACMGAPNVDYGYLLAH